MYESENEDGDFVLNFNQIDFSNYDMEEIQQVGNGLYEAPVYHKEEEDSSFQICLPPISIYDEIVFKTENTTQRNTFYSFELDVDDSDHSDFINWFDSLDEWVVNNIIRYHPKWFGDLWEEGGKMHNKPRPPPEVLANMFESNCDGSKITVRVPVRKGVPQIEAFDSSHTPVPLNKIKNCQVVPIVDIKSVQFRSKKTNVDIVLRGLCAQATCDELGVDYVIFSNEDDKTEAVDYGTSDDDESDEDDDKNGKEEDSDEEDTDSEDEDEDDKKMVVEDATIDAEDISVCE